MIIAAVVLLNAGIATAIERQAEHTIVGLSRYTPSPVPVVRGGCRCLVTPSELVPGDRILLERGTLVPADAHLVSSDDLSVNESALTGEALPVQKDADILLPDDTALAERRNMVFRGTVVTGGSGAAIVTATGMVTETGRRRRAGDADPASARRRGPRVHHHQRPRPRSNESPAQTDPRHRAAVSLRYSSWT